MPFERFGYLVLEQREMVCQHVVKKSRDSHLVASDYMKHLLDAVVVFLADIDLLAEPCRESVTKELLALDTSKPTNRFI